ncbi:NAD(P)/FAD-dependent oxidoreductase [Sphingomonas sp. Leaf4]|uniref:NAD(P)/FAD-dependent oxidoreductase n=1 Tax=Sphingomonas sp. Leaf4 TaxID=2876553 RepID=UPI001E53650C|nr:FAD-dependent monooxygenase [Sphingomonas sp. Leaf4]
MRRTPALIAGGGPAGAVTAALLARGGMRPLVIERAREVQDALCGGFLSWRTLQSLESVGVEAATLGGHVVRRITIHAAGRLAGASLPAPAIGLSRRRLDSLLLAHAEALGAAVERGVAIRSADQRVLHTADGAAVAGDNLFLATGKHDLRGLARPAPRDADPAMGVRVRLAASPALARMIGDAIELHPFAGGYAGIVLQEDGSANVCMAVRRSRLQAAGSLPALLDVLAAEAPALGERLAHRGAGQPVDAVANVPYGWRTARTMSGVYRLGDQAGVIPSLAGEGMGIAIRSGIRAAQVALGGGTAEVYQRDLARALRRPLGVAGMLRHVAERRGSALLLGGVFPGLVHRLAGWTRIDPAG